MSSDFIQNFRVDFSISILGCLAFMQQNNILRNENKLRKINNPNNTELYNRRKVKTSFKRIIITVNKPKY